MNRDRYNTNAGADTIKRELETDIETCESPDPWTRCRGIAMMKAIYFKRVIYFYYPICIYTWIYTVKYIQGHHSNLKNLLQNMYRKIYGVRNMQRIPYEGETYSVVVWTIDNGVEIAVCNTCDIHSTPRPNRNFSTIIATPPNWFWRWADETYENRIEGAIQHLIKQIIKVDKSRMKDCKHTSIYNQSKKILKKYKRF